MYKASLKMERVWIEERRIKKNRLEGKVYEISEFESELIHVWSSGNRKNSLCREKEKGSTA